MVQEITTSLIHSLGFSTAKTVKKYPSHLSPVASHGDDHADLVQFSLEQQRGNRPFAPPTPHRPMIPVHKHYPTH